jgi:dethiobiotin synthetase
VSFVVTGTDTGIGKTVFAAALAQALRAVYWKPVQSGLDGETDEDVVRRLAPDARIAPSVYRLRAPLSPHASARLDGVEIDTARLVPPGDGPLVIEGAGGLMVPLNAKDLYIDVFARWRIPVILVARTALGTINHSLLSLEALARRGVPVHGIAFVGDAEEETERAIVERSGVRRLGRLPRLDPLDARTLDDAYRRHFA